MMNNKPGELYINGRYIGEVGRCGRITMFDAKEECEKASADRLTSQDLIDFKNKMNDRRG